MPTTFLWAILPFAPLFTPGVASTHGGWSTAHAGTTPCSLVASQAVSLLISRLLLLLLPHTQKQISTPTTKLENRLNKHFYLCSAFVHVCLCESRPPCFLGNNTAATRHPEGLRGPTVAPHHRRPHAPHRPRTLPPGPVHEGPELPRADARGGEGAGGAPQARSGRQPTSRSRSSSGRWRCCGRLSSAELRRSACRKAWPAGSVVWRRRGVSGLRGFAEGSSPSFHLIFAALVCVLACTQRILYALGVAVVLRWALLAQPRARGGWGGWATRATRSDRYRFGGRSWESAHEGHQGLAVCSWSPAAPRRRWRRE